jgi:hypothetical protein
MMYGVALVVAALIGGVIGWVLGWMAMYRAAKIVIGRQVGEIAELKARDADEDPRRRDVRTYRFGPGAASHRPRRS